ncbi:MAG: PKD domain-containing protein, partial [Bacteroidales bacterium]|nr:PKD domain-containing protein [Bacteroidales bacterium]
MKKILFIFALLIQLGIVVGQTPTIFVSGQITDATTGNPIPEHPVTITVILGMDSLDATTSLRLTGPNGFYDFSTPFNTESAIVEISTPDCNGTVMTESHTVTLNNSFIVQDFSYCQSGSGCQANYYYEPLNPSSLTMGFYDISFGNHDDWYWDFGDGNSSTEPNPVHTFQFPGQYEVCLTISSADSSCYDMQCLPVFVGTDTTLCNAMFSYSHVGTNNTTIGFTDLSMGTPTNWLWEFGDGTSSSDQNPIHAYNSQGFFEVCLTISDPNSNCFSTFCMPVLVGSDSSCIAAFEYYPAVNNNLEIAFIDMSFGNHDTWFWDFGDNNVSTEQNPFHAYQAEGVYNVCLTISRSDGVCISTACKYVVVNNSGNCMSMFSWFPADSLPNTSMAIQFIDMSIGQILNWNWDFGDGTTSSEQNPLHIYDQSGTYQVCLTISGTENCQSTWCEMVTVGQGGDCYNYFTYQTAGNAVLFAGFHSTNIPAGYEWSFGDGTAGSGQQISHTYAGPGTYFVSLISWDDNNCSATSSQVVVVGDSIMFNQVYGQVFENNFPLSSGLVMIFGIDSEPGF